MLGPGHRLAAVFRDGIAAFIAAVGRRSRVTLQPGFAGVQSGFGEVVELRQVSYIHMPSVLFLGEEHSIQLGCERACPSPIVLGVSQDVGRSDAAFQ
ncbi:hypothetical protein FQZ97_1263400 [compost metagenome]